VTAGICGTAWPKPRLSDLDRQDRCAFQAGHAVLITVARSVQPM
jgi:hypothetical protein